MKAISNPAPFIIAAIIVALLAYWYFFTGTGNDVPLEVSTEQENPAQTRFKLLVSELSTVTFSADIFSDARFMGLVDLGTPVLDEREGRLDPFAPIPGVTSGSD